MADRPGAPASVRLLAASAPGAGRLAVFVADRDGQVWHKRWPAQPDKEWRSLGHPWPGREWIDSARLIARPAQAGRVAVFAVAGNDVNARSLDADDDDDGWRTADPAIADTATAAEPPPDTPALTVDGRILLPAGGEARADLGGSVTGGLDHVALVESAAGRVLVAVWHGVAFLRRPLDRRSASWELLDVLRAAEDRYTLLRPRDLVRLDVRGISVRREADAAGEAWVADNPQAQLIVEFPPQHVAETIVPVPGLPGRSRLAGPSSLAFDLAGQRVPLSTTGLLQALTRLPLTPRVASGARRSSRLELPWGVVLGLEPGATCNHRTTSAAGNGATVELWHTRLGWPAGKPGAVRPIDHAERDGAFTLQTPLAGKARDIVRAAAAAPDRRVAVDQLMLSTLGAWFSGSVSYPQLDWAHRTAMGRDYWVKVVTQGVIFPFGHRAAVVQIVERDFQDGVARLVKQTSLAITEPARDYGVAARHERAFPFQRVELQPTLLSTVDDPGPERTFWPKRGGVTLLFDVRGWVAGQAIDMRLPLLFASAVEAPEALEQLYSAGPRDADALEEMPRTAPTARVERFMPLAMRDAHQALEGTSQQVQSLTFGAVRIPGTDAFHPRVTELVVALPAVQQLLGQPAEVAARLSPDLLDAPMGSAPEAVLQLVQPLALDFAAANAGVVAAPSMLIDEITRLRGPQPAILPTDPALLFPGSAKLLGIVPLSAIIGEITGAPVIRWLEGLNPVATLSWKQRLARQAGPFDPGPNAEVSLDVEATAPAPGQPPRVFTTGKVKDFAIAVAGDEKPLLTLTFAELRFQSLNGQTPTIVPVISGAAFGGGLQLLRTLSDFIPTAGGTAPRVDITASQVRVTYAVALPTPLSVGVFSLSGLQLGSVIALSFANQPALIEMSFGSRASPFLVTVSGFGGGGYLELGFTAGGEDGGLRNVVGGIEFGAAVSMNFGIAAGEVHVFGGIVFTKRASEIEITGYLRIGGSVRVLGFISVSVELAISLTYHPIHNTLCGEARLVIAIDLTFWSTSVEIKCRKCFDGPRLSAIGPEATPRLAPVADALGPDEANFPWQTYCRAFARP